MTAETKERVTSGLISGVRLGTPGILGLILYELMQMNGKLDLLLQLMAGLRH